VRGADGASMLCFLDLGVSIFSSFTLTSLFSVSFDFMVGVDATNTSSYVAVKGSMQAIK